MIKVLFVYSDRFCSCTRKRTFEVVKFLIQHKSEEVLTHIVYHVNLQERFFEEHDIIVFQRLGANGGRISPRYAENLFELMDKYRDTTTYVYDIDDFIFDRQDSFPIKIMEKSDVVLAPNKFMEGKQKEHNPNTYIIRTHIDLDSFEKCPPVTGYHKDVINIGWFSGNGLGVDIVGQLFPKLMEKYGDKIHIHFFAIDLFKKEADRRYKNNIVKAHGLLDIGQMFSALKPLDFIINPMDHNALAFRFIGKHKKDEISDFINCKSEIKFVNAGAAGLPLITTPNPAYRHTIRNGQNGFLAENIDDWMKYIDLLIKNEKKRKQIGLAAKEEVYSVYSPENVANNYHHFFKEIIK